DLLLAGPDLVGVVQPVPAGRRAGVDRGPRGDVHDLGARTEPPPRPFAPQRGEGRERPLVRPALDELGIGAVQPDDEDLGHGACYPAGTSGVKTSSMRTVRRSWSDRLPA